MAASGENSLGKIEHIVVLMLENRSFDNVFGWLYDPGNAAPYDEVPENFEGLYGKTLSNRGEDGKEVFVGKTEEPHSPFPNPGEPFEDVYSQVYDEERPEFAKVPAKPPHAPNMRGFIRNYLLQKDVQAKDAGKIMLSLTPRSLPVLSALAHNYAVCDHWFSSIPTQTFCNRSFVHAGTSSGYVNNAGGGHCFVNETATIFNVLCAEKRSWRIYVGGWLLESFTLLTQKKLWKYAMTERFAHLKEFLAAARDGKLPNYSFIEPIYFDSLYWGAHNDMHPECNPWEFYGPSNVHKGEALIWEIYDAIRNGAGWEKTLLIILFDEHGGCYDHVPPPSSEECEFAIAPDGKIISAEEKGGAGFKFDRLGPRVPAIVVSAYTPQGTRLNGNFDHTSVLSTIVKRFELPAGQLGKRQEKAPDVGAALSLTSARTDRPAIEKPAAVPFGEELETEAHAIAHKLLSLAKAKPLSDLRRTALYGMAQFRGEKELHERISKMESELEAALLLMEHEAKMAAHLKSQKADA